MTRRICEGAVYILENVKARRVKVGMTINNVEDRLRDVEDKWFGFKATCQACGVRRLRGQDGNLPEHGVSFSYYSDGSSRYCIGSNELPLEWDTSIAEVVLRKMKLLHDDSSGTAKAALTKQIASLEKRIRIYQKHVINMVGRWELKCSFYTDCPESVEGLSHEILSEHHDPDSPIGEVFTCTSEVAIKAVEDALARLHKSDSVRKEVISNSTSPSNGSCSICGGDLTEQGTCPACIEKYTYL